MLPLYAGVFAAVEINSTWYRMPRAQAVERMCRQVPETFAFAAKLTRTLTHEVDDNGWRGQAALYRDGIAPLAQSSRLLAVLIQFAPGFARTPQHRLYLGRLLDALEGLPLAVEFRNASWAVDRVFAELERRRVALVAVDEPALPGLFPRLDVVTDPGLFYVRFHGRNASGWRSGNLQKQFDYDYTDEELCEWAAGPLRSMTDRARTGAVFFNNHVRAQAPRNARSLMRILSRLDVGTLTRAAGNDEPVPRQRRLSPPRPARPS
jgi:uncharacterized protein YecE (DUF72 family)